MSEETKQKQLGNKPTDEELKDFLTKLLQTALTACHDNMRRSMAELLTEYGLKGQFSFKDIKEGQSLMIGKDKDKRAEVLSWSIPVYRKLENKKFEYKMYVW